MVECYSESVTRIIDESPFVSEGEHLDSVGGFYPLDDVEFFVVIGEVPTYGEHQVPMHSLVYLDLLVRCALLRLGDFQERVARVS